MLLGWGYTEEQRDSLVICEPSKHLEGSQPCSRLSVVCQHDLGDLDMGLSLWGKAFLQGCVLQTGGAELELLAAGNLGCNPDWFPVARALSWGGLCVAQVHAHVMQQSSKSLHSALAPSTAQSGLTCLLLSVKGGYLRRKAELSWPTLYWAHHSFLGVSRATSWHLGSVSCHVCIPSMWPHVLCLACFFLTYRLWALGR